MVRKLTRDTLGVPAARSGAAPVSPARLGPLPTPAKTLDPNRERRSWMEEILFEAQIGNPAPDAFDDPPHDPQGARPRFSRSELTGATAGVLGPPRSLAAYRSLLHGLFDGRANQAAFQMLEEPVMRSMREVWQPGKPEVNRRVATEFMRYFMPKLGEAYGYKPCPVEFNDTLSGGYNGLYDLRFDRIYLPNRTLKGTFGDFVEVLTHEQVHCFQERLIARLNVAQDGVPLTLEERAIATYWRNEQPKYRSAMANGSEMSAETRRRYREIGQEYHAIQTGSQIRSKLLPN